MISVRCKDCNRELTGNSTKTISCGCSNMTTIRGGIISAVDLSHVVMLNSVNTNTKKSILSNEDLAYQEARRQRKVKKLDFEIR